jgi:hypothetical protein
MSIQLLHCTKGCRGVFEEAPPAIAIYIVSGCGLPQDPSVRASCVSHSTHTALIGTLWDSAVRACCQC